MESPNSIWRKKGAVKNLFLAIQEKVGEKFGFYPVDELKAKDIYILKDGEELERMWDSVKEKEL